MHGSTRLNRIEELKLKAKKQKDLEQIKSFYRKQFDIGFISYSTDWDFPTRQIWDLVPTSSKAFKKIYYKNSSFEEIIKQIKLTIEIEFKTSSSLFIERQSVINHIFVEIKLDKFLDKITEFYKEKDYYFYDLFINSSKNNFILLWEDQESRYLEIYHGTINENCKPMLIK
ncbi:hypothetical protein [Psychroserpens mesophilus]|uniref:hypothetical protein n=1 Tax=Psychroserpens mesophilus TaxID=325473 RepID=UPI000590B462|nr:hypothetical protein [Psychroserpens mesophilus]